MLPMHWTERVGRRLKLRDLHILLAVAQAGNMAKAARALSVSHPVVSKAISDLERTLGHPLFDRMPHGVEPTIFGRSLLQRGISVFDELQQAIKELEFLADSTRGEVRIGCTEPVAGGLLAVLIERLHQRYPGVTVHTVHADAATLPFSYLRAREIELVLTRLLVPISENEMHVETLLQEEPVVVANAKNKWAGRNKVELADLAGEPWILTPLDLNPGSPLADAFLAAGVRLPAPSVLSFSLALRISLLAKGRFLTAVPGSVLRFAGREMQFKRLPVKLTGGSRPVGIVTLRNRTLSPVARLFVETARAVTRGL